MSVLGVILVRIHSESRKILTRITSNTDTFYAVLAFELFKSESSFSNSSLDIDKESNNFIDFTVNKIQVFLISNTWWLVFHWTYQKICPTFSNVYYSHSGLLTTSFHFLIKYQRISFFEIFIKSMKRVHQWL